MQLPASDSDHASVPANRWNGPKTFLLLFSGGMCLGACVMYGFKSLHASNASVGSDDMVEEYLSSLGSDAIEEPTQSKYGTDGCECIGIDGKEGSTVGTFKGGKTVSFPADVGNSCDAWDAGKNPACVGDSPPDWCTKKWCYVDPCTCSLSVPPKPSDMFPKATYHGRSLYYSYATCGAKDSYSGDSKTTKAKVLIEKECATPPAATKNIGKSACLCAAIADRSGTTIMNYGGPVTFDGCVGSFCSPWDKGTNPKCVGDSPPDWCSQSWCYVDPEACDISTAPSVSKAMIGATIQGGPLYFSYATCEEGADEAEKEQEEEEE